MALSVSIGIGSTPRAEWRGRGYLAGDPPPNPNPDELDGRARILNVPTRVRIFVIEKSTFRCVRSTVSGADGTWRVSFLDATKRYMVVGDDGRGLTNSAIQDWVQPADMDS